MRRISAHQITEAVAQLCIQANTVLRADVYKALLAAQAREENLRARNILQSLIENADCARKLKLGICQDTGLPYVFVELGQAVEIYAGNLLPAINKGIEQGYKKGGLRNSVVIHPLKREAMPGFSPGVVHIEMVKGRHIRLSVLPKGFGSENKSRVAMFKPGEGQGAVEAFVIRTVKEAGADACPPFIVGVGIGGGMDQAAILAKRALLRPINSRNPDRLLGNLERKLLSAINQSGLGPFGLGGKTTCLGVSILAYPTHLAGLPVAVNISCHALRSAARQL